MTVHTAAVADGLVLSRGRAARRDQRAGRSRSTCAATGGGSSAASGSGAPTARSPTSSSSSPRASSPPSELEVAERVVVRDASPSRWPTAPTSRCASTAAGAGGCGSRCRSTRRVAARARGRRRAAAPGGSAGTRAPTSTSPGSARATPARRPRRPRASSSAPTAPTPARTARPTCSRSAAIPQGDYAPAPWLQSSRGYAVHVGGHGNGMRFHFGADRTTVSARSARRPAARQLLTEPVARRAPAPPPARDRAAAGPARMGLRLLEVARRLRPPDRGRGRLRRLRRPRASRSTRSCSTRPGRRNTTRGSPTRTSSRTSPGWCARFRDAGVRTVVWVTPWVNLDSSEGQTPPDPESRALHRAPASNYAEGLRAPATTSATPDGERLRRALVDGHRLADRLHVAGRRGVVARAGQGRARARRRGHQGRRRRGLLLPRRRPLRRRQHRRRARPGASAGSTGASMQRALDEVHPGRGVLFGRSGWTGQQATGMLWGGDQASDFWSLRVLVAAAISAAATRLLATGRTTSAATSATGSSSAARPSCSCAGRSWAASRRSCRRTGAWSRSRGPTTSARWRSTAPTSCCTSSSCRTSAPPRRPARAAGCRSSARCTSPSPHDERGWTVADAYGFGPALWVAPVLDEGAREREVVLPRGDWIETWSGAARARRRARSSCRRRAARSPCGCGAARSS